MAHTTAADDSVEVDVLDISDFRLPGGTAASVAEEVRAQAATGYSTALLQLDGPLEPRVRPLNARIRRCLDAGLATLVLPHHPVRAGVVVVRHPAVLQHATAELTGVRARRVVLVANSTPRNIDGFEYYSVAEARQACLDQFGVEPLWAPIGPLVRDALAADLVGQQVTDQDWVNIIDVDAWARPRTGWVADRPVIGRHSREHAQKWPADAATLAQAYPTDGSVQVRVLGGAAPAEALLGSVPDSWQVQPFGAVDPADFLAGLDFFVYFHNPRWVEAFGRTILEALASGAVAILPRHFAAVFGDGAVYTDPAGVREVIASLYADRAAYERQSAAGQQVARERFGHEAHRRRLSGLIGPPTGLDDGSALDDGAAAERGEQDHASGPGSAAAMTFRSRPSSAPSRVLLVSSNGAGMGHLTRLLAYAQRAETGSPYFLSLSQAVPIVERFGHPYEYLPSTGATGVAPKRWQRYFHARLSEAIGRLRPGVVVFDGTWPYRGIPEAREDHPQVPWVWSRRGMWYREMNRDQLRKAAWFDLVVEPGDFAAAVDTGATASAAASRVGAVTLLDREDLNDRATARRQLGLDAHEPTALVTLGAGNINDASSATRVVVDALRSLGLQICVTSPEIADRVDSQDHDVHVVSEYPLSRHYHAFDLAVSAAGYNSFHELLRFGVPTLFLPNLHTSLDDQQTRARYAAQQGWAHSLDHPEPDSVLTLLTDLLDRGAQMVAGAAAADQGNGAGEAMALIAAAERRG